MAEKTLKIIDDHHLLAHTRWSRFFYQASNVHHSLTLALHSGRKLTKIIAFIKQKPAKIDLNPKDINGWTIFVFTCKHGHNDVVKLLNARFARNIVE